MEILGKAKTKNGSIGRSRRKFYGEYAPLASTSGGINDGLGCLDLSEA